MTLSQFPIRHEPRLSARKALEYAEQLLLGDEYQLLRYNTIPLSMYS